LNASLEKVTKDCSSNLNVHRKKIFGIVAINNNKIKGKRGIGERYSHLLTLLRRIAKMRLSIGLFV